MDPFSCQQLHSLLEVSAYYPNTPIEMPLQVGELTDCSSYFPFYNTEATSEVSATDLESISSLDQLGRKLPVSDSQIDYYSSPVVDPHGGEEATTQQASVGKKRRNSNRPSLSSRQSKGGKNKKQKDPLGGLKAADHEMKATKACKEAPTGYIHVRARRGQATDSHSLAERVRRERISERMKMLQDLVPGCERVTGKALVLDEIINYVQSLQNQIEFLSMRLASLSPVIFNLGDDYGDCMNLGEITESMRQPIPEAANHIELTGFENAEDYTMVDSSASFLLQEQGPTTLSQDSEGFLMQVDHHGHKYVEQNLTFMW